MTPADIAPHDIKAGDIDWIHALNRAHETELSPLTREGVVSMVARATYARALDGGAFLLGFDQGGAYDSPNFIWHRDRFDRFLYVDRIAVAATHRRRGLAAQLYLDVFTFARDRGLERVVCEVNSEPPNPASDAFHLALGFEIVGEAFLGDRGKTVRYLAKEL